MSFSPLRVSVACLLLVLLQASPGSVAGFLPPQQFPSKVARQPSLPPPNLATLEETQPGATSTQLYSVALGLRMGAVATRPLLVRTAAALPTLTATLPIFLAVFSFGYAALINTAVRKSKTAISKSSSVSIKSEARSCPLFTATTRESDATINSAATTTSQLKRSSSHSPDLRHWALQRIGRRLGLSDSSRDADLTTQINKLEFVQTLTLPAPHDGLLNTTDGNRHAYLRRLVSQAFTPQALSDALPWLQQATQQSLESHLQPIAKLPSFATLSIPELCEECVLDTILSHYLGLSPSSLAEKEDLIEALQTYTCSTNSKRKLFPWQRPSFTFSYCRSPSRRQVEQARLYLESKIQDQIKNLKQNPDSSLLSQLILAKESTDYGINTLTEPEIIDNMLCLIVAGAQSTKQAMITCLVEVLGQNPKLYRQLVQEQREGSNLDGPCLAAVVDQALQLHPTSQRLVLEEEQHASPFGEGPRACLGQSLALLQIKTFLAALAQKVDSFRVVSNQMDQIELSKDGGATNKVDLQRTTATPATSNLEYPTTVTAGWLKDALDITRCLCVARKGAPSVVATTNYNNSDRQTTPSMMQQQPIGFLGMYI